MATEFRREAEKAEEMGLTPAEIAFYDALSDNKSAHDLMGDQVLAAMAQELAKKLRNNLSVDWQYKENVRARLRRMIKALLKPWRICHAPLTLGTSRPGSRARRPSPTAPGTLLPATFITVLLVGAGRFSRFSRLVVLWWSLGV